MYLAALCDDEKLELDKMEAMLRTYCESRPDTAVLTQRFESAEELLCAVEKEDYRPDLILMDIYMPGKSGIEAARELRELGSGAGVIFLTTSKEHALEAFQVEAVQYLVKPVTEQELFPVLERLWDVIDKEKKKYFLFKTEGGIRRVSPQSIVFCEAQKKYQIIYLTDGTQLRLHMTMTALYGELSDCSEFVRVGATYIVNLMHVENLNARQIQMAGQRIIYLPRGSYKPLREQYFRYYCEEE